MKQIVFAIVVAVTQALAITDVGGTIATNTVWGPTGNPPDSIYNIVSQVLISPGITLTIQPGVRVQSSSYGFIMEGSVVAHGTVGDSIRFTSSRATPNPGDWGGFFYIGTPTDSSVFSYCIIEYATYGFDGGSLIDIRNSTIGKCIFGTVLITSSTILNCDISDNTYGGIGIGHIYEDSTDCVVGGNLITNNGVGIYYGHRTTLPEMSAPNYFANNDTGIVIPAYSILEVDRPQEWNPAAGGIDCWFYADITITPSGRLTIMPGNVLKFYCGTLNVEGQIVATGTQYDSITFTSAAPTPNQGDWYGIWFNAYCPDSSIFEYCIIEYGYEFRHQHGTPLRLENSIIRHQQSGILSYGNVSVTNCEFSHNLVGIGCACYPESLDITICNSNFHDNTYGIYVLHSLPFGGKLPIFTVPSIFADNDFSIYAEADIVVRNNVTWSPASSGVECYLQGALKIDTTGIFTIAPGNTFKLYWRIDVYGQLIACGTEQSKITFTSALTNPAPGDWYEMLFWAGAQTGIMEHCIMEYADWGIGCYNDSIIIRSCEIRNSNRGITLVNTSGIIEHCRIDGNGWFGILVASPERNDKNTNSELITRNIEQDPLRSDTVIISNNTISNNQRGIWCSINGNPHVEYNEIYGNTEWGMYNEDNDYWIYAENNWWGDSTGPCDTSDIDTLYNPSGLGDRVSDHVDYDPWIGFIGCKEYPAIAQAISGNIFYIPRPNPFAKTTVFSFDLADEQHVKCVIYNALGQDVRDLCDERLNGGQHQIFWDGRDNKARILPAGVYWCRFETPAINTIKKVVKLK